MRTISYEDYLVIKGLHSLAAEHYGKATEYENALARRLGYQSNRELGHITDSFFTDGATLEEALEREGFTVEKTDG